MKKAILRYGVFLILIIMAIGLVFILRALSIRQKTSVQIFVIAAQSAKAYIVPPVPAFRQGSPLEIVQTAGGDIAFKVDSVYAESGGSVLLLTPTDTTIPMQERLGGSSHAQGYIYTGRTPLLKLVMEKVQ